MTVSYQLENVVSPSHPREAPTGNSMLGRRYGSSYILLGHRDPDFSGFAARFVELIHADIHMVIRQWNAFPPRRSARTCLIWIYQTAQDFN